MNIEQAAERIAGKMESTGRRAEMSPVVVSIIAQVLQYVIVNYGPTLLSKFEKHLPLNWCDQLAIRRALRNVCPREHYKQYGPAITGALFKSVDLFTTAEIDTIVAAARVKIPR